jgi:pteridine reductase
MEPFDPARTLNFDGAVALVTGGSARLGRAIALAVADRGCHVVLHYQRSVDAARATASEIEKRGRQALVVPGDFADPVPATRALVARATERFGAIDVLVNNAAVYEDGGVPDTSEASFDRHFAINAKAPFFLTQAFAAAHAKAKRGHVGHVVNIADWRAHRPGVDHVAYAMSKAALVALTKSAARALGPDIRVNAVAPGAVLPPESLTAAELAAIAASVPLRSLGRPEEVARAVVFLLESAFVTGELLHVSGGEEL